MRCANPPVRATARTWALGSPRTPSPLSPSMCDKTGSRSWKRCFPVVALGGGRPCVRPSALRIFRCMFVWVCMVCVICVHCVHCVHCVCVCLCVCVCVHGSSATETGVQTKRGRRQQSSEIRRPADLEDEEALRHLYLIRCCDVLMYWAERPCSRGSCSSLRRLEAKDSAKRSSPSSASLSCTSTSSIESWSASSSWW